MRKCSPFGQSVLKKDGFDGLYIIESCDSLKHISDLGSKKANSIVLRQPNISIARYKKTQTILKWVKRRCCRMLRLPNLEKYDYRKISQYESDISLYDTVAGKKIFYCISTGWDTTPRHQNYGEVMLNMSPDIFEEVFRNLYIESVLQKKELLFINAWNEWGEGMVLEPDNINGAAMLEKIRIVRNSKSL